MANNKPRIFISAYFSLMILLLRLFSGLILGAYSVKLFNAVIVNKKDEGFTNDRASLNPPWERQNHTEKG